MIAARMLIVCSLAFSAILLTGCSKKSTTLNKVTGRVFFKGAPLQTGLIVFIPDATRGESGKIGFSKIGPDGSYAIFTGDAPGVTSGWYRVTVAGLTSQGQSYDPPVGTQIDPKYRDPALSQLQCEVKANRDNNLDFNLD